MDGQQAVVALPECIDTSNAGQVREQLLLVINRGAAVLIADLAATASCDYSGVDALMRAYHRADASGTDLRLVISADVVRRVLSLSGLDRLISVYPTLEAAVVAGARCREVPGEPAAAATLPAVPDRARAAAADRADCAEERLDWAGSSIFIVGMSLQAAVDLPRDLGAQRITEALGHLDDVVRAIRDHGFAWGRPPDLDEQSGQPATRMALPHQRVVRAARAVQCVAADIAVLLERRPDLLREPGRIDYPTEIKQWQVIADQAAHLAERWERQ